MAVALDYAQISEFYDSLVRFDGDLAFFTAEARSANGPVLELMAGTGRVTIPLLEAGIDLTCVDYSLEMLTILKRKLAKRNLSANTVRADVRKLNLPHLYALAIIPLHSFSELLTEVDQLEALRAVHGTLADGGKFVFALLNPAVVLPNLHGEMKTLIRFSHPNGKGEVVVQSRSQFDAETRIVTGVKLFQEHNANGEMTAERSVDERYVLLDRQAVEDRAQATGFRIASLHGDYAASAFEADKSPHMIWTLQK